jgi:hypothetical protein
MSWLCSQVLVAEFLRANSWDSAASVPSKSIPTAELYWQPDKTTARSRRFPFGMTSQALMADGVSDRVDRLAALGNAQVPLCAVTAFLELAGTYSSER